MSKETIKKLTFVPKVYSVKINGKEIGEIGRRIIPTKGGYFYSKGQFIYTKSLDEIKKLIIKLQKEKT